MPLSKHGYPRSLILKDGEEVVLRQWDPDQDGSNLIKFFKRIPEEDRWYFAYDVTKLNVLRGWLRGFDVNQALLIVAVNEAGEIVATSSLHRYNHGARRHIGRLRVMLDPKYRRKRLGTYLILDLVQLAVNLGLAILQAEFIKGPEDEGIRAASKLDFFEQASLPDYVMDKRGNFYDLSIMIKRINQSYDDF